MKPRFNSFVRIPVIAAIAFSMSAHAEILSFDGNVATGVTTHTINATDWADYVGGSTTFNSANDWGRLYWRGSAGDGQYIHFDLSSLTGLTLVAPTTVTLQNANPTWGGGVDGSFVATANAAWTAGGGQPIPGATAISNAVNATGSYGWGASVSWGIGSAAIESIVASPGTYHGLAVIGGSGSTLHFSGPASPYLTAKTGTLSASTGIITADTGTSTWNAGNYAFVGSSAYSPTLNTLTISGELIAGTSGAGTVTINDGGTLAVTDSSVSNNYQAVDGTTVNPGGKLTSNGNSHVYNLTLAGGELASTGFDGTNGGWSLDDATTVNGGVTSTISAQHVNLVNGTITVDTGSTLNVTGYIRSGSLLKDGLGTMTINGWQGYTGGTTVTNGTLELIGQNSGNGWLRGAVTVNAGATLKFTGGDGSGFGWNGPASSLTINGGTFDLTGGSSHIGFGSYMAVALNDGGTITGSGQWNGDGGLGFSSSGDSTNTIAGSWNLRSDGGANHTFTVGDGAAGIDLQVSANLSDQYPEVWWVPASNVIKQGAGTMVFSGSNSYNGSTTVSAGKLVFSGNTSTSSITVQAGAAFEFAGTSTYVGPITVNAGTLTLNNPVIDDASPLVITSGSTVNLNFTGSEVVGSLDIDGSGPLPAGTYNSSTHPGILTGTGSLVIAGANGTWTSLADGNWSDAANWQSNIVATGYDATATFNAATGATVTLDSNRIIGNLAFDVSAYTLAGASTLTLDALTTPAISVNTGTTATISANLAGTLGMEKTGAGTLVLTGVKSYTGGTTVTGGTLELAGGNSGNSIIRGALSIAPGATVSLTGGDGSGFGWNNPVTSININGGTIDAINSSHIGFGSFATMILDNGSSVQGSWQWNGDGLLGFSSYGDSTNTISGNLNLRADAGANHTFFVDEGASATDLQIDANLSDQWPEYQAVPASGLTKSGTGTLVLNGSNTYDGNTVVSDGALTVTATSKLHFRPTTNGATNSVSGSATSTLSFLGTVDLDLTAAVAAGGNVWNLFNLASFTTAPDLSSIAGVSSNLGTFTEGPTGTWKLPVTGAEWVFTEADGNLAYVITATDYDNWVAANGVTGGPNDDDDSDGLTNHEEYAFGLDPTGGSSVNAIAIPLDKTTGKFSYTRRATPATTGLTYTVWISEDLATWTEDSGATASQTVTGTTGEVQTVEATLTGTLPLANPKLFIQVRAN